MDAFEDLAPVADHYASLPVGEAFTWDSAARAMEPGEWYMVAFRSILRTDADEKLLTEHDDRAHEEAAGSAGFVHYYKGPMAADRSCLSFCIWDSRAEARAAAGRPAHREAVALIIEMYDAYLLEFLTVRKRNAAAGFEFEPYDATPEVGSAAHTRPASLDQPRAILTRLGAFGCSIGGGLVRQSADGRHVPHRRGRGSDRAVAADVAALGRDGAGHAYRSQRGRLPPLRRGGCPARVARPGTQACRLLPG